MFDYEVVSTVFERDNLKTNYHFPASAIIDSGVPRLDAIAATAKNVAKRIIHIPSWCAYLVKGSEKQRSGNDAAFKQSHLYQGMRHFFDQLEQSGLLKNNGWFLDVKLHPNLSCYRHLFTFKSEHIKLVDDINNESNYSLAITDFSSYIYDFVYAGARTVLSTRSH